MYHTIIWNCAWNIYFSTQNIIRNWATCAWYLHNIVQKNIVGRSWEVNHNNNIVPNNNINSDRGRDNWMTIDHCSTAPTETYNKYYISQTNFGLMSVWGAIGTKTCQDNLKRLCGFKVSYIIITINMLLSSFSCMTFVGMIILS